MATIFRTPLFGSVFRGRVTHIQDTSSSRSLSLGVPLQLPFVNIPVTELPKRSKGYGTYDFNNNLSLDVPKQLPFIPVSDVNLIYKRRFVDEPIPFNLLTNNATANPFIIIEFGTDSKIIKTKNFTDQLPNILLNLLSVVLPKPIIPREYMFTPIPYTRFNYTPDPLNYLPLGIIPPPPSTDTPPSDYVGSGLSDRIGFRSRKKEFLLWN